MLLKKTKLLSAGKRVVALAVTAVLLLAVPLSGCVKQQPTPTPTPTESQTEPQTKSAAQLQLEEYIQTAIQCVRENPVDGWSSEVSYPYDKSNTVYSELSDEQKALYDEMLPKVRNMEPFEYSAEKYGYDVLDNVLIAASALCKDYPEFEIYFDIEEVVDGDMTTALRALYFLPIDPNAGSADREKVKKEVQTFENDSDLIVAAMPRDFSTYDKYRYLAAVISLITNYDYTLVGGKSAATAYGAIELGMCICQGYSTGFEYLCRKADLWCAQVSGVSQGVSHAWNLVKLESGTYHVDVTWADADDNKLLDAGWQSYFMLTQDEILVDHEIDDGTVATGI